MNLFDTIMAAQGGGAVRRLGQDFGLNEEGTSSALQALLPALATGLRRNTQSEGGLESLLGALGSGRHERYLDDPDTLGQQETIQDGNGILGHILGNKDVSRQVARNAAAKTGIGEDVLKKMLPMVATLVMSSLSKQTSSASQASGGAGEPGLLGMLAPLLDADRDGSVTDDISGLLGGLFGRR
jgi:hypothetical protein